MVSKGNAEIALLAIHPEYVQSIISGEKKVEFRRQKFSKPVNRVVEPVEKVRDTLKVRWTWMCVKLWLLA